jgi:alpha-amylase/alpha-mannosidase (GH57 family)
MPKLLIGWNAHQPSYQRAELVKRIERESYLPVSEVYLSDPRFLSSFNLSWSLIQLMENLNLRAIENLQELVDRGQLELLVSPSHHPISTEIHPKDLEGQLELGIKKLQSLFGEKAILKGFYPPELAFNPRLVPLLVDLGFEYLITEGAPRLGVSSNWVYLVGYRGKEIKVLLRNKEQSLRFSIYGERVSGSSYVKDLESLVGEDIVIFNDLECIGHHWGEEEGSIDFLKEMLASSIKSKNLELVRGYDIIKIAKPKATFDLKETITWGINEDLTYWRSTQDQQEMYSALEKARERVMVASKLNPSLKLRFYSLQMSDRFIWVHPLWNKDEQSRKALKRGYLRELKNLLEDAERAIESQKPI